MSYYYCWKCETMQYDDDLAAQRELMDPGVPGSWMTWSCCGYCGSDEIVEITAEEFRLHFNDLLNWVKANDAPVWAKESAKFLDIALEMLYE